MVVISETAMCNSRIGIIVLFFCLLYLFWCDDFTFCEPVIDSLLNREDDRPPMISACQRRNPPYADALEVAG